ncbi:MAM and LDL-receptor class A domain-containing protein 1-like [Anneissia japonica]|uniref:MAM and LDL-receptor class A domain-containing protein 1-like n=1 Tax=Anneissia japonica TaxID=1529436 RepID=UPI001425696F|nr:MAM and LDL-receptor class A domain-containing protein 1-like [Anneissia japonica]
MTLCGLLRAVKPAERRRWPEMLGYAVFMCNTTPHSVTGVTPYLLMIRREPKLPIDHYLDNTASNWDEDYIHQQSEIMERAAEVLSARLRAAAEREEKRHLPTNCEQFAIGTLPVSYTHLFVQDKTDDFDWIRTSGSTPSSRTGPKYDHTYGTSQGFYMYIETSNPRNYNETARIWTPSYPATNGTCVEWFYHMYGTTVNILNVYIVNTAGTVGTPAWTERNDQGNFWRLGQISVETNNTYNIVFEGIVGSSHTGDIALDDVRITDGACLTDAQSNCDFEDPYICYFDQDELDDFDWIRTSGSTPTSGTGPTYDHTYGTLQGSYMYIETSYPRYNGETARLWTSSYPATNGTCVKWFYHMYGATVNTLNVYIVNTEGTVGAPAWANRNDRGNIWRLGKLSVETKSAFQIVFEGIVGSSDKGDIALDDVSIIDGACLINETCDIDCLNGGVCALDYGIENCQCMSGFVGPTCNMLAQSKCDFEDPYICYFDQDELDDFDWIRTSGSTPTSGTGPGYDHTYGTLQGSYMYIETSYPRYNNETARLWTSSYPATNGTCVKWFYHMYGATVNTLNVYIVNTEGTVGAPAWTNRNNQGNIWRLGKLSVETKTSFQIVETKSAFQIVFEGIVGSSDKGDIALDDVSIIDGACLINGNIAEKMLSSRSEITNITSKANEPTLINNKLLKVTRCSAINPYTKTSLYIIS